VKRRAMVMDVDAFRIFDLALALPGAFSCRAMHVKRPPVKHSALAGALFTDQISRWTCHWLTVTIRAEWER